MTSLGLTVYCNVWAQASRRNWVQDNTMSAPGESKYGGFVQDKDATLNVFRCVAITKFRVRKLGN